MYLIAKVALKARKFGDTRVLVSHIDSFKTGGVYTLHLVFCDWGSEMREESNR